MKYKATLKILGRTYESEGKSISACLLKLKPGFCKTKSVLTIETEEGKRDRVIGAFQTARMFSPNQDIRDVAIKQVSLLFNS